MKKSLMFIGVFFLVILFAGSLFAVPVGKITSIEGRVDVLKTGRNVAAPVSLNDPVDVGDIYRAKSASKAEITFANKNTLRIATNTRVEIKEYMFGGEQSSGIMKLHRGRVQVTSGDEFIKKVSAFAEGNRLEVHTPNAVAGIRGSSMIVSFLQSVTGTLFITGKGYQYNPNDPEKKIVNIVAGGISFVAAAGGSPTPPRNATEAEIAVQVNAVTPTPPQDPGAQQVAQGTVLDQSEGELPPPENPPNVTNTQNPDQQQNPPPPPPPPPIPPNPATSYTGSFASGLFYNDNFVGAGNFAADLAGSIAGNTNVGSATVTANYVKPDGYTIWSADFEGTSSSNGAYLGYAGGAWTSWSGNAIGLYIEDGKAGFLTTSPSGDSVDGSATGSGGLVKRFIGPTTITPAEGQSWLDALKDANNVTTETFTVTDQGEWSIGDATFSAANHKINTKTVNPDLAGGKSIGVIREMLSGASYNNPTHATQSGVYGEKLSDSYYSIGSASLSDEAAHNKLTMNISNTYMTTQFLGTQSVYYEGTYDALESAYRMVGIGTKEGAPLSFVSKVSEGRFQGLFGGTDSLWTGNPVSVTYMGKLTNGGGTLDIHGCFWGWNGGSWGGSEIPLLPGGVQNVPGYSSSYNQIVDSTHPITQGVASPPQSNPLSWYYFTSLLPGTNIIYTADGSLDHPTSIEYTYNGGKVIASMQSLEYAYKYDYSGGKILYNTLSYVTSQGGKALLIQDVIPWFDNNKVKNNANEYILNELGVNYDVVTAAEFANLDLSPYSTIIIASDQTQSFYNTMAANISKLESFVGSNSNLENVGFSRINSYDYVNNNYMTYDGGAYRGFVGTAKVGANVFGKDIAVYIAPDGSAGYLFGDLQGTVYENANNMFLMNGSTMIHQLKTAAEIGINPQDLYNSVSVGTMDGTGAYFQGKFTGGESGGTMAGQEDKGYTMAIKNTVSHIAQDWGIYGISLYGNFTSPTATWTGKFGGAGSFGEYYNGEAWEADSGYWLASVDDGAWFEGWIEGNVTGKFITHKKLGILSGYGIGASKAADSSWEMMSLGLWAGDPLKFWSSVSGNFQYFNGSAMVNDGSILGAFGGAEKSLGDATDQVLALATVLGQYAASTQQLHVWVSNIESYNYDNYTGTTLDGWGAFKGFATGTRINSDTAGNFFAVYIDPEVITDYKAGFLYGDFTGTIYPTAAMFEMAGGIKRVEMDQNVGIAPADLMANIESNVFASNGNDVFTINENQMGGDLGRPYVYQGENISITGLDWGVWYATTGGKYTGLEITDSWSALIEHNDDTFMFGQYVVGSKWSNNKIEGSTAGFGADLIRGQTWMTLGETVGTFNPDLQTFQTVSAGIGIGTEKFLAMIDDPTGKLTLQKLNVPCVEVGTANLTQSEANANLSNVAMNNVRFFATFAQSVPQVWATNGVSGDYTGNPLNQQVGLSGGGLNAQFTMKGWDTANNKWMAGIAGSGNLSGVGANAYNGSVQFKGAGAGSIAPSPTVPATGSFSGTATGVARAGGGGV
jgi:hypothetical protein